MHSTHANAPTTYQQRHHISTHQRAPDVPMCTTARQYADAPTHHPCRTRQRAHNSTSTPQCANAPPHHHIPTSPGCADPPTRPTMRQYINVLGHRRAHSARQCAHPLAPLSHPPMHPTCPRNSARTLYTLYIEYLLYTLLYFPPASCSPCKRATLPYAGFLDVGGLIIVYINGTV